MELDAVEIGSPAFEIAQAFGELKIGVKVVVSQELQHFDGNRRTSKSQA